MNKRAHGKTRGRARPVARDLRAETSGVKGGLANSAPNRGVIVYNGHAGLGADVQGVAVDAGADTPGAR